VPTTASGSITAVSSQFAYNAFLATVPFLFVLVSIVTIVERNRELFPTAVLRKPA